MNKLQRTVIGISILFFVTISARRVGAADGAIDPTFKAMATITVNTLADTAAAGFCTLREAINNANSDSDTSGGHCLAGSGTDTINITATGTIQLTGALPDLDSDMNIVGAGANQLTVRRNTVAEYRIFLVAASRTVSIRGLTVTNGISSFGAGIRNQGNLTLDKSVVTANTGLGGGGGAGIYTGVAAILTMTNSTISNNISTGVGGGIENEGGTLTITNSTISGNMLEQGTGGGIYFRSTTNTPSTITNSTIAFNTANTGAAAGFGGGIYDTSGTLNLKNTIVSNNTGQNGADIFGFIVSQGFNLVQNRAGSGSTVYQATDLPDGTNPLLAALSLNSPGTTQTHSLNTGSPTIDKIPAAGGCNGAGATTDQRGVLRPVGPMCDIGAFEGLSPTAALQFSPTNYTVIENDGTVTLTVTLATLSNLAAAVDYATLDGTATQRTRYIVSSGTLDFAAGETTKTISIILEDNALVDGAQQFSVVLSNPQGATINGSSSATVTINDNDVPPITANPLETHSFFVRQQYYDFLARLPDMAGLDFWTGQITGPCGGNPVCLSQRRWQVSNAFFYEQEFQQTGSFVYRLYRAAYGNTQPLPNSFGDADANPYCVQFGCPLRAAHVPSYDRFVRDRARVVGGANLPAAQLAFGNTFTARSEFTGRYPLTQTAAQFVDALLTNIQTASGADLTGQRTALITLFNSNGRGAVLYRLAEDNAAANPINNRAFIDAEYSRAFVLTQYFGYLRRDPDMPGLNFWLRVVNRFPVRDATGQNAMVCAFITSAEYQTRFSLITPRTDTECPTPP